MARFSVILAGALTTSALVASPAAARSHYVAPYIEATQAVAADLSNGDDVVT